MPGKTIKLRDKRTIDVATGKPVISTDRKHASISEEHIRYVTERAREHGIDPYTALAINLQETGFKDYYKSNPFMLGNYNYQGDVIDESMRYLKNQLNLGKKLGKKTEEEIIQSYNGYGTIKNKGVMYGIDTAKTPINMKENPVYGKRIVNLRDSVIRQNPEIMKIVEGYKSGGTKLSAVRKKPGGSNAGKYEGVHSFAGPSGGAPKGSFPINTRKRAKAALAYAHNAPNPSGIRSAVHRKYPDIGKKKCHGGKVKHMEGGGLKPVTLSNIKIGPLAKSPSTTKLAGTNNPGGKQGIDQDILSNALATVGDMTEGIINSFAPDKTDFRDNPLEDQRKRDSLGVAGNIAGSTLKGAATGLTTAGPVGALVGGAFGLLKSGVGAIFGAKGRRKEREEASVDWANNWASEYADALEGTGYKHGGVTIEKAKEILRDGTANGHKLTDKQKSYFGWIAGGSKPRKAEGGEITGGGTSKSDSITKKVEDGSFIVPTENKSKALELGRQYLGWENNEHADRNYPGTEVKVSDGEVLFTPEEVGILSYNGIDLDRLAPKSENKIKEGAKLAKGTKIPTQQEYVTDWQTKYEGSEADAISAYLKEYPSQPVEEKTLISKLADYLPEVAGALQTGAGIAGSIRAGRMPDINVSHALKQLSAQQRKDMEYGLGPAAKDAMLISAEKARRDTTNAITNRGGSTAELMSNLQGVLSTTIDKKFGIELADVAEKARKKSEYARTQYGIGEQEFNIQQIGLQNWKEMQDINAGLLSAGIANIVGARKLKSEMELMKKIGSTSPTFILNR